MRRQAAAASAVWAKAGWAALSTRACSSNSRAAPVGSLVGRGRRRYCATCLARGALAEVLVRSEARGWAASSRSSSVPSSAMPVSSPGRLRYKRRHRHGQPQI